MMDILVIILVFMLKSYASNSANFAASGKIDLPMSLAEEFPTDGAHVVVEPESISFDGEKVLDFSSIPQEGVEGSGYTIDAGFLADDNHRIVPLYDALVRAREKTELLMSKATWKDEKGEIKKPNFHGVIIIQADKSVRYDLLKKIMFTGGAAGYKVFKFVTVKKEEA
jgi:biopolymer transport protein ExbD